MIKNKKKLIPEEMPEFLEDIKNMPEKLKKKVDKRIELQEKIHQSGIMVFATPEDRETGKIGEQHIFIQIDHSKFPHATIRGVPAMGNISLCGKIELMDDKLCYELLWEIEDEKPDMKRCCKICIQLYDKYQYILPSYSKRQPIINKI